MSKLLRRTFIDICNGYSKTEYSGNILYIKHLSHFEHHNFEEIEEKYIKEAKDNGLPDEKEQLAYLNREGLWTQVNEDEITRQKSYIARLHAGKKSIILPSVLEQQQKLIESEELKLKQLEYKKSSFLQDTCENYAQKRTNDYYIMSSLYKDQYLSIPYFTVEDFEYIDDQEMRLISIIHSTVLDVCSDENIKKLTIQDFFIPYFNLCNDDIGAFFGKSIMNFTFYQVRLGNYARYFKHLMENNDINNLPEHIKNDPDKLVDYLDTTKKGREAIDKQNGAVVGMVGATQTDIESLNGNSTKLPNKPMNKEELLKFMGGR